MKKKAAINLSGILLIGISILTIISFIKGILISLDIDESYAVAMAYRLTKGDRLVVDMWEPHQFSAFLAALFTAPYVWIRGNTDYLIIYLRTLGVLIHTGLGLILYKQLCRTCDKVISLCILFLHLNFLPKWVQTPEFELMHYWFLLGVFLLLYSYFTSGKHRFFLFLGGICMAGSVMCYPTMVLLYPFYILGISVLERQYFGERSRKFRLGGLWFTAGAFLAGIIFLGYLFSYMSLEDLLRYLSYIFLDTSHTTYTMSEKWLMYFKQLKEQGVFYLGYLVLSIGTTAILCFVYRINPRAKGDKALKNASLAKTGEIITLMVLLSTAFFMQVKAIFGNLFEDENQFFFQFRYIAFIVPAIILAVRYHKKMAIWLYLCILPAVLSLLAVLFVTNMDTNVSYAKTFLGVLGSLLIFYQYGKDILEKRFWKKSFSILQCIASGTLLAGLLVCRLLLIRVTGCLPVTILAPLEKMESGPEKGIYVLKDTAQIWNDNYRELVHYVEEEDRLLYIGAENLIYVKANACVASPSTQGTTVYNEMYLYYYEEHPQRLPNVIVFDKSYAENPVYTLAYSASLQSQVLFDWIQENYADSQIVETDYMIILRKQ